METVTPAPGEYDVPPNGEVEWSMYRTTAGDLKYRCAGYANAPRRIWGGPRRCSSFVDEPFGRCWNHSGRPGWTPKARRQPGRERPPMRLTHEDAAKVWWWFRVLGGDRAFDTFGQDG